MQVIVSILSWTFGAISAVLLYPVLVLSTPFINQSKWVWFVGFLLRGVMKGFLLRIKVTGRERVDTAKAHVFMANHASFFDLFILAGYIPGDKRGVEAEHHFKWPFWGFVIRRGGQVPIDRENPRSAMRSIQKAADYLKRGISVLILPEGTRTTTGEMLPFKKLPFKLAKMGGAGIAPIGISGTFGIKRKTSWIMRPGRVDVRFGDPIPAEVVAEMDMEELMALTRERIASLLTPAALSSNPAGDHLGPGLRKVLGKKSAEPQR